MSNQPHLSWAEMRRGGADEALAHSIVSRAEKIRASGAPALYSLKHLALTLEVDYGYLRGIVRRDNASAYRAIRIPKNRGGFRDLQSPSETLMQVQRWILHEVLDHVPRHINNYAYFPGITARSCAARHSGANWMVKADLHNYFPSISERLVFRVFKNLGYSELLAFELSRLCTWERPTSSGSRSGRGARSGDFNRGPYELTKLGYLPQGSPTSGALANAVTRQLDDALSAFALERELVYTRYSDDMTFSRSGRWSRSEAAGSLAEVRRIVTSCGFELHAQKSKVVPPGARKIVLGMLVEAEGVGILPEQRRMIDLFIHAVRKYGPVDYAVRRKFDSVLSFINHVEGWLAYLSHIDREWTSARKEEWRNALARHGVQVGALG